MWLWIQTKLKTSDHVTVFTILNLKATQKDVDGNRTNAKQGLKNVTGRAMKAFLKNLKMCLLFYPGIKVIKLEYSLKVKIKCNDWLLADTCPQAVNPCALF